MGDGKKDGKLIFVDKVGRRSCVYIYIYIFFNHHIIRSDMLSSFYMCMIYSIYVVV